MGDSSDGDSGCLFNGIIGDMKAMMPMWEDFLVKASKFYNAVKQSAITADVFLESFQKLADATTASKGATRDIGISFTKLVMRHKSIEHKLRTYIGVLTDNFIGPLQEKLEEWKKTANQLEKDHSKDFKRAKSETKKSVGEVMKLRKKVVKKGRTEYHSQYKDAWKLANIHIDQLEDQEKHYLRKLMMEERSRAIFFFNCYRPVVEQELTLMGEIEHLQTLLEDTIKQCTNPAMLPPPAEDSINNFKAPERAALPKTEASSPPPSPTLESARQRAFTSITKGNQTLQRSNTVSGITSGYSTLRKKGSGGPAPLPVGIPNPVKSPSRSSNSGDTTYELESHESLHSSSGNVSNFSSMSSLSTASGDHIAADVNHGSQGNVGYGDDLREQVAYYTQNDAKALMTGSNGIHSVSSANHATRTSWSSLETSDSSGIGSYISLNSQGRPNYDKTAGYNSDGPYEPSDESQDYDFDEEINMQMANLNTGSVQMPQSFQQNLRRNTDATSSMRGTRSSGAPYRRSNSLTEGESMMMDYRMNIPGRRSNTVYAKNAPAGAKGTPFQAMASGQNPAQLRAQLSPTGSPVKGVRPPTRKVSSPPNLYGGVPQQRNSNFQSRPGVSGISENSNCDRASIPSTVYVHPNMSRSVSSSVGDQNHPYATRNAAFQHQQNPPFFDRNASHLANDYAVPTTQPYQVKPSSPVDFPPPPPSLQAPDGQQQYHQNHQSQQHDQTPAPLHTGASQYQVLEQLRKQQQQPHSFPAQPQQQQYPGHQQQQYSIGQQQPQYQAPHTQQVHYPYPSAAQQWAPPQQPLSNRCSHSPDDDMPAANPGSFLDELQQKRNLVRSRTLSSDSNRSQSYGN